MQVADSQWAGGLGLAWRGESERGKVGRDRGKKRPPKKGGRDPARSGVGLQSRLAEVTLEPLVVLPELLDLVAVGEHFALQQVVDLRSDQLHRVVVLVLEGLPTLVGAGELLRYGPTVPEVDDAFDDCLYRMMPSTTVCTDTMFVFLV
ncbi:MAG: hypothetical protein EB060_11195 [Proteobacteria bacterium]|nr:hypothetical protein [Pseudomonadota bacterium]